MPELPEVETTRRGISPHIVDRTIEWVVVREPRLRWPIPPEFAGRLAGARIHEVKRRGKYILIQTNRGTLIAHLGMSGSLRVVAPDSQPRKHDHVDIVFEGAQCLRFHDPRRFGCLLWTEKDSSEHPLLAGLGIEPFDSGFSGDYLHDRAAGRSIAVKPYIMDSHLVVGVGNIYATESLFRAGIDPRRAAGKISLGRYHRLAGIICNVLDDAIGQGGTTLRDFVNEAGSPGYFQQTLAVYGREGQPCVNCSRPLNSVRLGQRATVFCSHCQR